LVPGEEEFWIRAKQADNISKGRTEIKKDGPDSADNPEGIAEWPSTLNGSRKDHYPKKWIGPEQKRKTISVTKMDLSPGLLLCNLLIVDIIVFGNFSGRDMIIPLAKSTDQAAGRSGLIVEIVPGL